MNIEVPYLDLMVMVEKAIKYDAIERVINTTQPSYVKELAINGIVGIEEKQETEDE